MCTSCNLQSRKVGRVRALLLLLFALSLQPSCKTETPTTQAQAVQNFFSAYERNDCEGIKEWSDGKLGEKIRSLGCEESLKTLRDMGTKLVEVKKISPDARAPNACIVHAVMGFHNGNRESLLRVEKGKRGWRLVSM